HVTETLDHLAERVAALDPHRPDPRQVIEADLLDQHPLGRHAELSSDLALEVDRDVAQPDRAVSRVEKGPGDDPDRVREVDDPCVWSGKRTRALRDLEH